METVDLKAYEGLSLQELIGRFPAAPTVVPSSSSLSLDYGSGSVYGSSSQALSGGSSFGGLPSRRMTASSDAMSFAARRTTMGTASELGRVESVRSGTLRSSRSDDGKEEQDDIIGERDYEDLLRRATKGVIGNKEQAILFAELMQLPAADFTILQSKVQEGINSKHPMLKGKHFFDVMSREKGPTIVDVPKCALDFDQAVAPIGGEVVDKFSLILKAGKTADYRIILPPKDLRYDLRVLPMQGKIKPGKVPREDISVFISCKTTVHAQGIITIEIDGGSRFFIRYNVQSEPSQFGISVDEMTMGDDAIFEGFSYRVPLLLSMLRAQLMEGKALTEEGIFRVAGDETETASAKSRINRGVFQGSHDINAIANLIKIWFRELPTPVLSEVPMDVILNADSEAKCVQEFEKIGEPNRSLMLWLLDLMSQVAMNEQSNRMNARSLSIVMGPNLYHSSETRQLSAMEALRLSQQTVSFVFHLLNHRLRFHRERMGLVQN